MSSLDRIKKLFPEEWATVLERCETDPELVEICEDIHRLCADLDDGLIYMSDNLKADVLGSIEALVEELRVKINLPGPITTGYVAPSK